MKGTGLYLTLLLGCLLHLAATNEEQYRPVETRRLVHSPVAGNYRGGDLCGSGYSRYPYGPRGYGVYGGYDCPGRGCRYGNKRSCLYINLLRGPKYSMGKVPFSSQYSTSGFQPYGGGFYYSSIVGNFPSWNYGSSLGGGKSSGFEYFSYFGGGKGY